MELLFSRYFERFICGLFEKKNYLMGTLS